MTESLSRRRALGVLLAPLVAARCSFDEVLAPMRPNLGTTGSITLIGGGDPHATTGLQRVHREKTAAMIKSVLDQDPTAWAFNAGDLTHKGTAQELNDAYHPSWGQFKDRTLFTFGNHDRKTDPTGAPYYEYTGAEKYYAKDLDDHWRLYVLNCESFENGGPNQPEQLAWLKADLAQHSTRHILAMWHYPHFSNVCAHVGKAMTQPFKTGPWWQALQEHGAEFLISGHVHRWERFPRMVRTGLRTGVPSEQGMRQFVMGTGGGNTYGVLSMHPNCEKVVVARGVVRFDLYSDRYEWTFTDTNGVIRDSGMELCRAVVSA